MILICIGFAEIRIWVEQRCEYLWTGLKLCLIKEPLTVLFFMFIYTANGEPSSYPTISADFSSFKAILIALTINSLHFVLNQTASYSFLYYYNQSCVFFSCDEILPRLQSAEYITSRISTFYANCPC